MNRKLNIKEFAKKCNVSSTVVRKWIAEKRIAFDSPISGVILIDENEKRPKKMNPWQRYHEKDSVS
jgi:uncharacterized protein YjcR